MNNNIYTEITYKCIGIFYDLKSIFEDEETLETYLLKFGLPINHINNFPTVQLQESVNDIFANINDLLIDIDNNPPSSFEDYNSMINSLLQILNEFRNIKQIIENSSFSSTPEIIAAYSDIIEDIINYQITNLVINIYPELFSFLIIIDVFRPFEELEQMGEVLDSNDNLIRLAYTKPYFNPKKLIEFIKNPLSELKSIYNIPINDQISNSTQATEISNNIYVRLKYLLNSLGASFHYGIIEEEANAISSPYKEILERTLSIYFLPYNQNTFGFSLALAPESDDNLGLVISPFGSFSIQERLNDDWLLILKGSANIDSFAIGSNGLTLPDNIDDINYELGFILQKITDENGNAFIFGSEDKSHISVENFYLQGNINGYDDDFNYDISLNLDGLKIVLKADDGFLGKILTNAGINFNADLGIGYSRKKKLYFKGSSSLEVNIPIKKTNNNEKSLFKFESLKIKLVPTNDELSLEIGASFIVNIGAFSATVKEMGLKSKLSFPTSGGNLGKANLDFGIKPPSGLGIKIDSPKISGSGFLNIDTENKRYTGFIQLKFGKVTFTAIGILRTELPGSKKGYSLVLVITAEGFKPIALGFGFNLIGVGGLIGLNRTANIDVLRSGIKTGNNEKILFPKNVIENADSIISALDTSFPEKEGRFIFGPLAKINWGTGEESILTIDMGLIIEVPKPVTVALIGVLKAIFPPSKDNSEENAKLIIKVNFLGVFDAEKKMIAFDASLYESKIASFTISGDMAFRLSYGENPGFLLSVGGFHPAYTPPPMDLPTLKRLSISLVDEKKSKVYLETYFAVTSNTVQFGARVIASAENGLYNFAAVLWFDALFQFKPFYFIVSMGGMIAIKSGGSTILTAGLDFTLQGPTPWKIDGKVYFEICKVRKSIKINKEFGKKLPEQNADVKIEKLLTDAIDNVDNWQIINPRYADLVTISSSDEKEIYLHPTGSIAMNQSSVPLNLTFVKFGNSKPEDYSKFNLDNFKINNEVYTETKLKNGFAPSMYKVMTNEQKLSAPSFEEYESGFIVGTDKISGDFFTKREVGHYEKIIDRAHKVKGVYVAEAETIFNAMLDTNVQNFGGFSGSQNNRPYDSPSPVGVSSEKYTVTNRDTGSPYDSQTFDSFTDALDFSNSILNTNPAMKGKIKVVSTTQLN